MQDGQIYTFDHVIGTMPLGWLKQNKDAFEPALPSALSTSIEAIGYGCLEKVGAASFTFCEESPLTNSTGVH